MAYTIDPPEENQPDEGSIMCSTECPFANGQVVCSVLTVCFSILISHSMIADLEKDSTLIVVADMALRSSVSNLEAHSRRIPNVI